MVRKLTTSMEGSFTCTNMATDWKEILGLNEPPSYYHAECFIGRIQKRKHKKRRINKKWAKKYGYKEVYMVGDVKPTDDNQFEILNPVYEIRG